MSAQYIPPAKSCEWGTPQKLFDELNMEFHFTLDACATDELAKCNKFFSSMEDALSRPWDNSTFCNPPYGPAIPKWIQKAYSESLSGKTIVMLLPARTDTEWFHAFYRKAEIRFLKGRLNYSGKGRAPFPSILFIFKGTQP